MRCCRQHVRLYESVRQTLQKSQSTTRRDSLFNLLAALALHLSSPLLGHQRRSCYQFGPSGILQLVSGTTSLLFSVNLIPVRSLSDSTLSTLRALVTSSSCVHSRALSTIRNSVTVPLPSSNLAASFTNPSHHRLSSSLRTHSTDFHQDRLWSHYVGVCLSSFPYFGFRAVDQAGLAVNFWTPANRPIVHCRPIVSQGCRQIVPYNYTMETAYHRC